MADTDNYDRMRVVDPGNLTCLLNCMSKYIERSMRVQRECNNDPPCVPIKFIHSFWGKELKMRSVSKMLLFFNEAIDLFDCVTVWIAV